MVRAFSRLLEYPPVHLIPHYSLFLHQSSIMKFLSAALPSLVEAKFASAKASGALIFSDTELSIVRTSKGIPVSKYIPLQDELGLNQLLILTHSFN